MESPVKTLSRRDRERQRRRGEMLDSARAVFAEKGYSGATLEEIAQRAEFGKGTLYNYFEGGKQDILLAIFEELYDDLTAIVDRSLTAERLNAQSFRVAFRDLLVEVFSYFEDRSELFLILVREAHRLFFEDPETQAFFVRQRSRLVGALAAALRRATEMGQMRPLPAEAIAHMILGNINGCQAHACMHNARSEDDSSFGETTVLGTPERRAEFLTTTLLDGLAARLPSGGDGAPAG